MSRIRIDDLPVVENLTPEQGEIDPRSGPAELSTAFGALESAIC